jgi:hypothetical protein
LTKTDKDDLLLEFGHSLDAISPSGDADKIMNRGAENQISYVHCFSWNLKSSVCHSIDNRRYLRSLFYKAYEEVFGLKAVTSFFPSHMKEVKPIPFTYEPVDSSHVKPDVKNVLIADIMSKGVWALNLRAVILKLQSFASALKGPIQVRSDELFEQLDPNRESYVVDLAARRTGILVENPDAGIRFMFLSKEGIRLPDTDGRIHVELQKNPLDVQKINELIFDQAVIWPFNHFARVIWSSPKLNLSRLNLLKPPIELQWIEWK